MTIKALVLRDTIRKAPVNKDLDQCLDLIERVAVNLLMQRSFKILTISISESSISMTSILMISAQIFLMKSLDLDLQNPPREDQGQDQILKIRGEMSKCDLMEYLEGVLKEQFGPVNQPKHIWANHWHGNASNDYMKTDEAEPD